MLLILCGNLKAERCHSPLVSGLQPASFRSSSQLSDSHGPGFAKLNRREGAGGWSPQSSDRDQWLEVDLAGRTQVTAVATQGRYGSSDWQTAYLLMFSDTGHNWRQYRQEGSRGAFPGNSNADSVVQHKLQHPVIARFIRLIPLDWNRNGRIGLRLEAYGCPYDSDLVSFAGHSSLLFRLGPTLKQMETESFYLKFKTMKNSGVILHMEGQNEQSLTLELEKGKLVLLFRKGRRLSPESRFVVSSGSLLDDQHWHHVSVEHHSNHLNLTVDKNTAWMQIPASLSLWVNNQFSFVQMSVGAGRDLDSNRNFQGCLENLVYNGLNLVHLAKQSDHRVTAKGNVTFACSEPVSVAATFTGPHSFLRLPGGGGASPPGMSVALQFRTWDEEGLLLTFDLPRQEGAVWLYLSRARLHLQTHRPGRAPRHLRAGHQTLKRLLAPSGSALNDGQWHSVDLTSAPGHLTITVDGVDRDTHAGPQTLITTGGHLFFGGCPAEGSGQGCTNPFGAFQGCMRLLAVNKQPVDLISVQQRLMGDYSHLQIDMCGIIDRCSPSHCEHGGGCTQSWSSFHCNCSGTGYSGATCHSSVYEQSCEAYKHRGNASGYYYIDVDGSGPIKPQLIYCDMTEDKTWMEIQHNNTELTRVRPSAGGSQHRAHFEYASDDQQLEAVIRRSEGCQQELAYHCRSSRLLNTPASTQVLFSFDVGNGPLVVSVEAGSPLDDGRWHRVQAERNVKQAWLRLDRLPAATKEAPADGHTHLQLNSQLFIGGTASRQRGFRGCLRGLQLNGVGLDLEQRARVTPGVRAGCPGHCSSYGGLCRHGGRCLEGPKSFSCDCRASAYAGAFCRTEVSVSFKPETTISYTFLEQTENEGNRSSNAPPASTSSDTTLTAENISLSFRTGQSPALLLYVGSSREEYLALLLNKQERLEVRYRLDPGKRGETLRSKVKNLADRRLHSVAVSRLADSVSLQIDQNEVEDFNLTADVEFNGVRSLILGKVHSQSGSVGAGQPVVNAIRRDSALIGGLIAVAIFILASALAVLARFLYGRKETRGKKAETRRHPEQLSE
ncbi:unnamed protein product [Menidia menidia]|uniref:(Atlantic silverside) hypothetical protein n=1 Tax=Menidia menidia TaxID=238744 RepID=A0A8S4BMG3_9TELE|nr:unnamed protein product [Menidia menidia]